MTQPVKTTWYIHCLNTHTNELIAEALKGLQSSFGEQECADGVKRPLYMVPEYSFVSKVYKSRKQLYAKFEIFRSQNDGKPTLWKFEIKKKISLKQIKGRSDTLKQKALAKK